MNGEEKNYIEKVEKIIENFGKIQKTLVLDKEGIKAITRLVEEWEGKPHTFSLDDPVTLKGRQAAEKVLGELEKQSVELSRITPPERWSTFHQKLSDSISLQIEGYREMLQVFKDREPRHLLSGQEKINQGMGLLSARANPHEN